MKSLKFKMIILGLVLATTPGCLTFLEKVSQSDTVAKIQLGVDVVHLDKEFENVRDTLMLIDWTTQQRLSVNTALATLQNMRNDFETMKSGSSEERAELALKFGDGQKYLNEMGDAFNAIANSYIKYLTAAGLDPDPDLTRYHRSGVRTFNALADTYERTGKVDISAMREMIGYALRGYVNYKAGGVPALIIHSIQPKPETPI